MTSLEIACFEVDSVGIAWEAGAHRAEFCKDRSTDGISPDYESVKDVLRRFDIPLNVMIRPRPGSYVYAEAEFQQILSEIKNFRNLPINGLVLGSLTEDGCIHQEQNKRMVDAAGNLPCTFHRAFDELVDFESALEILIACGYTNVLTSAGKNNAWEGREILKTLIHQAGTRITIIPGGGIRSDQIKELVAHTHCSWVHSSAITISDGIADPNEIIRMLNALKPV